MARKETVIVDVQVKTKAAEKSVDNLFDGLDKQQETAIKNQEELNNTIKDTGKAAKGAKGGLKTIATGFKAIGLAVKAAGIGLIIAAFVALKDIVSQNQPIVDALSVAMETIKNVFQQVFTAIGNVVSSIKESSGSFDALKKTITGLITIGLTPLRLILKGLEIAFKKLKLAYAQAFGDDSLENVTKLKNELAEAKVELGAIGAAAIKAGKDIKDNIGEALTEIKGIASTVSDEFGKISLSAAKAAANLKVALTNEAKTAAADLGLLVAQNEKLAEIQRQIRDDDRKTFQERIEANNKILALLEKEGAATVRLASKKVELAKLELSQNQSNIDLQVALTEATTEQVAAQARLEGIRSEALSNNNALLKEQLELSQAQVDSDAAILESRKDFNNSLIKDDAKRLEAELQNLNEEKIIEEERLANKIESYEEGTAGRIQAEIEFNQSKEELDQLVLAKEDEISQFRIEKKREEYEKLKELEQFNREEKLLTLELDLEDDNSSFEARRELLKERESIILEDERLTQAERLAIKTDTTRAIEQLNEAELDSYLTLAGEVGQLLTNLSTLAAEGSGEQKALAIAGATIDTLVSSVSAYKGMVKVIPGPLGVAAGIAAAASSILSGFATVKKIAAVKVPGTSSTSDTSPPPVAAPSFNLVGGGASNVGLTDVLASNQIAGQNTEPIRAFVVSTEITSQQELDRNIESTSTVID
tara:strand:- start:25061 stop:27181 length:2121 start_codon:yes stop_codon:yes gene_type:complete